MNPSAESSWRLLLSFAGHCRGAMAASVALAVAGVAAGLLPYAAVSVLLTALLQKSATVGLIVGWSLAVLAGYFFKIALNAVSTALSHQAAFSVLQNIRLRLAHKLACVPMGLALDTPSGKLKNLMLDTVEKLELPLAHIIPEMTANILGPLGMLVYLFYLDWRLALAALATVPIGAVCFAAMLRDYGPRYEKVTRAAAAMNAAIVEYIGGLEVIKVFNQSAASYGKYVSAVTANRDRLLEWFRATSLYFTVGLSVAPSSLVVVLPVGGLLYMNGSLDAPALITALILSLGLVRPFIQALEYTDSLALVDNSVAAISRLLQQPEMERPEDRVTLDGRELEFVNVRFAYGDQEVLKDVSFRAAPGGLTAIVGPSGSGKSTIARLAASFWEAGSGAVRLGGREVKDMPLGQVMEMVSYVSQENFLFNVPLRENIRFGRPEASDEEVAEAARAAACHDFIMGLDQGYDTLAGEAGGRLSGGERQRVAIARAILKNSPIVVLDEATAFADPENEDRIQQSIAGLVRDKTVLVIAHRLSTIVGASQIIVMNEGRVEASGRHGELLQSSELYRGMWAAHIAAKDKAERADPGEGRLGV